MLFCFTQTKTIKCSICFDFQFILLIFFRTTVSVIVISTLLLYKALVAQVENDPKESDHLKLQRLEKRVRELESLLGNCIL